MGNGHSYFDGYVDCNGSGSSISGEAPSGDYGVGDRREKVVFSPLPAPTAKFTGILKKISDAPKVLDGLCEKLEKARDRSAALVVACEDGMLTEGQPGDLAKSELAQYRHIIDEIREIRKWIPYYRKDT